METTPTRKGKLSDAIDAVTTMEIVDAFGVPNRTRRGRTYLICPSHDDHEFGSCYIDKNDNGYYCYVCGEHVDKWNMVLYLNGNNKRSACEWFFNMAGIIPEEDNKPDPYRKALQLIRKLEQYIRNYVIYQDLNDCEKSESSYGRNSRGQYFYSELAIANPLMELYKTDKATFKKVVTAKLKAEEKKAVNMAAKCHQSTDDGFYIDGMGIVPLSDMEESCNEIANNIKNLINEVAHL